MTWFLGQIQASFSTPSITFTHQNSNITLTGEHTSQPNLTIFHQLHQLIDTDSISSIHLMTMQPLDPTQTTLKHPISSPNHFPPNLAPKIYALIHSYKNIFQPLNCPPTRPHDHHITLLPSAPPINVKPYRYPSHKKCYDIHNPRHVAGWYCSP